MGEPFLTIFSEWIDFLKTERLWGLDDPIFPKTRILVGQSKRFEASGLERTCWKNADSIRTIFKREFEKAGLRYFNPHSFRNTVTRLGQQLCQTPESYKAWSQNAGHEKVMTTLQSYGQIEPRRQREIILGFTNARTAESGAHQRG